MKSDPLNVDLLRNPSFDAAEPAAGIRLGAMATIEKSRIEPPFIAGDHSRYRRCSFGRFFAAGQGCLAADTTIGAFVSLGDRVSINAGEHPLRRLTTHLFPYNRTAWKGYVQVPESPSANYRWSEPATIGSDVWIGTNAVVGSGIQIGHGAVIGANSFVNRPVPSYAICVGSPARVIGYRFDEATIARLLASAWWLRPMSVIETLPFDNVELCLERLGG